MKLISLREGRTPIGGVNKMASSKRREQAQLPSHPCPVLLRNVAQRVTVLWTQCPMC